MAGWRVGFAAGNRQMLNALKAIKGYYDYGLFQAVQIAAIVALRHGEPRTDWRRWPSIRCAGMCWSMGLRRTRLGACRNTQGRHVRLGGRSPSRGGREWGRSTSP